MTKVTSKSVFYLSSLAIVPILFALFYGVRLVGRVYGIDRWVPKWDTLLILCHDDPRGADLYVSLRGVATIRAGQGRDFERRQFVCHGHRHRLDHFANSGVSSGAFPGAQADHGFARAIGADLAAGCGHHGVGQSVSVLDASHATYRSVLVGAARLSSPGDGPAGYEHLCFASDRFCPPECLDLSRARHHRL